MDSMRAVYDVCTLFVDSNGHVDVFMSWVALLKKYYSNNAFEHVAHYYMW